MSTKDVDVAKEAMTEVFASLKGNARQDAKAVLGTLREIVKNVRLVPGDKIREWLVARIDIWMTEIDSVGEMTKTEVKHTPKFLHCEMCGKKHDYPVTVISRGIKPDFETGNLCSECAQGSIELVSENGKDLLELVEQCAEYLKDCDIDDAPVGFEWCRKAKEVLRKARGE